MSILSTAPVWFQGYDIAFNVIFAIITIIIAGLSYRSKALTGEKKYSTFGTAFVLIAIAHIIFVIFALLRDTAIIQPLLQPLDFIFLYLFLFQY